MPRTVRGAGVSGPPVHRSFRRRWTEAYVDEKDGTALLGLALGVGLAVWATSDGNIGLGRA